MGTFFATAESAMTSPNRSTADVTVGATASQEMLETVEGMLIDVSTTLIVGESFVVETPDLQMRVEVVEGAELRGRAVQVGGSQYTVDPEFSYEGCLVNLASGIHYFQTNFITYLMTKSFLSYFVELQHAVEPVVVRTKFFVCQLRSVDAAYAHMRGAERRSKKKEKT